MGLSVNSFVCLFVLLYYFHSISVCLYCTEMKEKENWRKGECVLCGNMFRSVSECGADGCLSQCPFDGQSKNVCNCPKGTKIPTGELRSFFKNHAEKYMSLGRDIDLFEIYRLFCKIS